MRTSTSWILVIFAAVVVGGLLVVGFAAIFALGGALSLPTTDLEGWEAYGDGGRDYASNGERIYFTGISDGGGRISFRGGPMWLRMHGGGCANCHGNDGRGGVPIMMGTTTPSDIRYHVLTEGEHDEHEGEEHPPYTDVAVKRAIANGLNPAGEPLDYTMPRWQLSEDDLEDLLEFLKTLE